MEIIVRLHRFVRDKLQDRRIAFLPHPVAWTEVPETLESLRKQRGRWYRGLRESLRYHRAMLWRRKYGRIGWFALPTFWVFEYCGPLVELAGYALHSLPGPHGARCWATNSSTASISGPSCSPRSGYGILVNVFAVLVGAWRFRFGLADRLQRGLLPFSRRRDVLILLLYAVLENFGYPPAHAVLAAARTVGRVAGKDRLGKIRPRGVPRRGRARRMAEAPGASRVLIVDDDPRSRGWSCTSCARERLPARRCTSPPGARRWRRWTASTSCCSTTSSPTPAASTCSKLIRARPNPPAVVLITAHGNESLAAGGAPARRRRLPRQGPVAARAAARRSSSGCGGAGSCARRSWRPSTTWSAPSGSRPSAR